MSGVEGGSSDRKRKNKGAYFKSKSHKKGKHEGGGGGFKGKGRHEFQAGMVGILATLNDKQHKAAEQELLNILPDFLPEIEREEVKESESGGDDLAALIAAENAKSGLLQYCDTKVPNIVFIRLPTDLSKKANLNSVVTKIYQSVEVKDAHSLPRNISRYVNRLVPVTYSCGAYLDRITKAMKDALTTYFESLKPSDKEFYKYYSLCFRSTYNQSIKAQEVEDILVCHMATLAPTMLHRRNAKEHVMVIGVHIVKAVCCISFLPEYYRFAKYNLAEYQAKQASNAEEDEQLSDDKE